jgi:GTP cyclohydrolase IA
MDKEQKIRKIADHFANIMITLGLDLDNPSLKDTPARVAKMYVNELFSGLDEDNEPKITMFPNDGYDQLLIEKNITVTSTCEHHFQPIIGVCHIAYLPTDQVIGLSKLHRVVQYYSARPTLQERLTKQIAEHLQGVLNTDDVAVMLDCEHFCCRLRGVKDLNSTTVTTYLGGMFLNDGPREEFLQAIRR